MRPCILERLFLKTNLTFRGMNGMVQFAGYMSVRLFAH